MSEAIIILLLACALSFTLGAFLMWRNMRLQLDRARAEFNGMREAFQAKHADTQKMFESQHKLWEAYKELLNYKLKQQ